MPHASPLGQPIRLRIGQATPGRRPLQGQGGGRLRLFRQLVLACTDWPEASECAGKIEGMSKPGTPGLALVVMIVALAAPVASPRARGKDFHFKSPSGNINCRMNATYASCTVAQNSWPRLIKRPADCDLDWVPTDLGLFRLRGVGRWAVDVGACRGDIGPLCVGDSADACSTLGYGKSLSAILRSPGGAIRGIRCSSATSGITCRRIGPGRGVHGFRIAREGYVIL